MVISQNYGGQIQQDKFFFYFNARSKCKDV